MKILDKSCSENESNCDLSDLNEREDIYDFSEEVYTTCEAGISEPE